jgi:Tol biopolymer transport system component
MWSPDGTTLAFTLSTPSTAKDLEWLPVGVICGIDRATGKGRVLAHGASPTTSLEEPTWPPDGQALMLAMHQPKLDPNNTYVADVVSVVRYNLADGNIQRLMQDGTSPQLAPDGQRLAYLHRDPQTVAPTLMLAQPDGQNPQPIALQASSGGSVMPSISTSPRWSPDSQQIALAVSGATAGASPDRSSGRTLVDRLLGVGLARAHGAPSDIWLINRDGQALNRVTRKSLDDPRVAWSPDGKHVAYTSTMPKGVYVVDLTTMQEQQLSTQGDAGGITWAKH